MQNNCKQLINSTKFYRGKNKLLFLFILLTLKNVEGVMLRELIKQLPGSAFGNDQRYCCPVEIYFLKFLFRNLKNFELLAKNTKHRKVG